MATDSRFTVRIPDDLDDALDTFSRVTGVSKNSVFVDALRSHLADEVTRPAFIDALKLRQRQDRKAVANV